MGRGGGGGGRAISVNELRVGDQIVTRVYNNRGFETITKVNSTTVRIMNSFGQTGRRSLDSLLRSNSVEGFQVMRNKRIRNLRG